MKRYQRSNSLDAVPRDLRDGRTPLMQAVIQIQDLALRHGAEAVPGFADALLTAYLDGTRDPFAFDWCLGPLAAWVMRGWLAPSVCLDLLHRHQVHPYSLRESLAAEGWDGLPAWEESAGLSDPSADDAVESLAPGQRLLLTSSVVLTRVTRIEGWLVAAQDLALEDCPGLETIRGEVDCFGDLRFTRCLQLRRVEGRCRAGSRRRDGGRVILDTCPGLESLEHLEPGEGSSLYIDGAGHGGWPPSMLKASVREMIVRNAPCLQSLGHLEGLFGSIEVENCPALHALPSTPFGVEHLSLEDCPALAEFGGLSTVHRYFRVHRCPGIHGFLERVSCPRIFEGRIDVAALQRDAGGGRS